MLTGRQFELLNNYIANRFGTYTAPTELARMLKFRLDKSLGKIVLAVNLNMQDIAFEVISCAEREGWTEALIAAAQDYSPHNKEIAALAEQLAVGCHGRGPLGPREHCQGIRQRLRRRRGVLSGVRHPPRTSLPDRLSNREWLDLWHRFSGRAGPAADRPARRRQSDRREAARIGHHLPVRLQAPAERDEAGGDDLPSGGRRLACCRPSARPVRRNG